MASYGMKGHALFGFQDSGGVAETNSYTTVPFFDESIILNIEEIEEQNMYSRFHKSPSHAGAALVEGDISMEAEPVGMAALVKGFFSRYSFTGSQHRFKSSTFDFGGKYASHPATMEIHTGVGSASVFYDLQSNALEITQNAGELMTLTLGVLGSGYKRSQNQTPSFPNNKPIKWSQSSIQIDNAPIIDITEFTLNAEKNIDAKYTLNTSNAPTKFKRDGFEKVEISGTMLFQAHSYQQAFEEYGVHSLKMNFKTESSTLLIDAPSFKFTEFSPNMEGQGIIEADFSGICEWNADSQTAIDIRIDNTYNNPYGKVYFILDDEIAGELNGTYNLL